MTTYLLKRILSLLPVMLVVALITFAILHLTPGDPAQLMLGTENTSPERLAEVRAYLGLDKPLHIQFLRWLWGAVRGDLGKSYYSNEPVLTAIAGRLEPTLLLATFSAVMAVVAGIPIGVLAAIRHESWLDHTIMVVALLGLSIPSFWLGLSLILLFSVNLSLLPAIGYQSLAEGPMGALRYLLMPALALCASPTALIARMMRSCMLDVLREDYIRTARSKGLKEPLVIFRHALKNAFLPVLTVVGLAFAALAGGAVVTETVFALPGVGRLVMTSVAQRDYPVIQGVLLLTAFLYVVINLFVDLCYAYLDPRITYG